ncbi:MAG: hypothetical protein H7839_14200 [Magnetococcus sp. YQC-5]
MKVSIGMRIQPGPWGGGNRFGMALAGYLKAQGHEVTHDLSDTGIDIILLAEPDHRLKISAYDHGAILRYLLFVNRRAVVVHRINNTSEARDDPEKKFNQYRIQANRVADHTVFVSQWVLERYQASGFGDRPYSIILNGADHRLWCPNQQEKARQSRLKLVTHHWSGHPNKGLDVYQQLDNMLAHPPWSEQLEFTYIGRLPEGFTFRNSRHIPPMTGEPLLEALRKQDVYLTASRHEAGPNHVLEGALCGLPLLYMNSGSMAEYCSGFGLEFTQENLAETLTRMIAEHGHWVQRMERFPYTSDRMCQHYLHLFEHLMATRQEVLGMRHFWRSPRWLLRTLLHRDRR